MSCSGNMYIHCCYLPVCQIDMPIATCSTKRVTFQLLNGSSAIVLVRGRTNKCGTVLQCTLKGSFRYACMPSTTACHVRLDTIAASLGELQRSSKPKEFSHGETDVPATMWLLQSTETQISTAHANENEQIQHLILRVKAMFQNMNLGEVSLSSYDTAWVALVPSLHDPRIPQFPQCLDWIERNQLPDGSWGDKEMFLAFERVCNTLACVVALKTWNRCRWGVQKGIDFIHRNIERMGNEDEEYMPTAFEVVFPSLLEDARLLGLDLPYDSSVIEKLKREREKKLEKIPLELVHKYPTTLLHSLEGIHRLVDWNKILKLQTKNGSFLYSTASTACALKYTHDKRCLDYLNHVLDKFHEAVPSVYPLDLFERLWMVDRLERLGISRYFEKEIKDALDYVYRCWTDNGIAWAKDSNVFDADDTAMAFRILRLHGYPVSPEVFYRFKKDGQFYCFEGETRQSVTAMFNLNRAAQIQFSDERILEEVFTFTESFLKQRRSLGRLKDKWVISRGIREEVSYTLEFPWWKSLQRVEARQYINHYNVDDAWIAKSLYRMPFINNEVFRSLAIVDYNKCQSIHKKELTKVLMWNQQSGFDKLTFARQKPAECFFSIAATLFEPEFAYARIVWTQISVLVTLIDDLYDVEGSPDDLERFINALKRWDPKEVETLSEDMKIVYNGLYNTINMIGKETLACQDRDFTLYIRELVERFVDSMHMESKWKARQIFPTLEEYMENGKASIAVEAIIQISSFFLGEKILEEWFVDPDYLSIMNSISTISRISNDIRGYQRESRQGKLSCVTLFMKNNEVKNDMVAVLHFTLLRDTEMRRLTEKILGQTRFPRRFISIHLNMARIINFFYSKGDGHTSLDAMYEHVNNTLFRPIT
ncbi:hypothetical protein KP509_05G074100 [Ceratopteris richardii]|uniref:Uncharacterized protein n=2 Tax=Ceratopteris richardii TaxID=49495 RepID=A0A8T2UVK6_CERRI|nr:hypothetical protein KP509_05G074100 [Ceratopteris richardii]